MLKYKCLLCEIEWGDPRATESDISHGYCPTCIQERYTSRIHKSQREAGYSDCFNRGRNNCPEGRCSFRSACQDDLIRSWKRAIIHRTGVAEPEGLFCDVVTAL